MKWVTFYASPTMECKLVHEFSPSILGWVMESSVMLDERKSGRTSAEAPFLGIQSRRRRFGRKCCPHGRLRATSLYSVGEIEYESPSYSTGSVKTRWGMRRE